MAGKEGITTDSDMAADGIMDNITKADNDKAKENKKTQPVNSPKDTGYKIGGYKFAARPDYERALKEQETINYITANTNFSDIKAVLKMYNRAVENKSFKTAIGVNFMKELRDKIVSSGILDEEQVSPIPVQKLDGNLSTRLSRDEKDAQIKRYREAYENADAGRKIRNIIIAFLVVIIVAMVIVTYMSRYSVFTYFTDYKTDMENELIDQYEHWQKELEKRESAVKNKEDELGITYDSSIDESVSDDGDGSSDDSGDADDSGSKDVSNGVEDNTSNDNVD